MTPPAATDAAAARRASGRAPRWLTELAPRVAAMGGEVFSPFLPPAGGGRRSSAVLILFGPSPNGPEVILTVRARTLRSHPGQVSFPGGGIEAGDLDAAATALREAAEEIGLNPAEVDVLAQLPTLHIPVSGYDVTPVLAWWARPGTVHVTEPAEVEAVLHASVEQLLDPERRFRVRHPSGYMGAAFEVDSVVIWGFTAGLLDRVLDLAGLTREWDPARVRAVN